MLKNDLQSEHLKTGAAGAAVGGAVGVGSGMLLALDIVTTGGLCTLIGAVAGVLIADNDISKERTKTTPQKS